MIDEDGRIRPEIIARAADLAGLAGGGRRRFCGADRRNRNARAAAACYSRSVGYDPPPKPQRAFTEDYPNGAPGQAGDPLRYDVDGRPLTARWVAGRRVVEGADQALSPAELDAFATQTTGAPPKAVARREIGGDSGRAVFERSSGRPLGVAIARDLSPEKALRTLAHENGHIIDELIGQIPVKGLADELRGVYNSLNNPNRTRDGTDAAPWSKPARPQDLGYRGEDIPREYIAEAIRAYLTDPNYLKTVAPKTAAAIRKAAYDNPRVRSIIQFNAGGALPPGLARPAAAATPA